MAADPQSAAAIPSEPAGKSAWELALRETPDIPLATRGAAMTLATHSKWETGEGIRPSIEKLAATLGVNRSTLQRHVKRLVEIGWLECVENNDRAGRPNVYRLSIPLAEGAASVHEGAASVHEGAAKTQQKLRPNVGSPLEEQLSEPRSADFNPWARVAAAPAQREVLADPPEALVATGAPAATPVPFGVEIVDLPERETGIGEDGTDSEDLPQDAGTDEPPPSRYGPRTSSEPRRRSVYASGGDASLHYNV